MTQQEKNRTILKEIRSTVVTFIVTFAAVFLFVHFIAAPVQVIGSSMYPGLQDGDFGFADIIGRKMNGIERGDIVIINREEDKYLVKRAIGLPGDTVSCENGVVLVNGEEIAEDWLDADYRASYGDSFNEDFPAVTLGEDEYFVMGDNRVNSRDSRVYGAFTAEQIYAKGVFVVYPLSHFGIRR